MIVPLLVVDTGPASAAAKRPVDLAELVSGTYDGAVVADTRGGSRSGIVITVKRAAKNVVEVSCDYARVPTVRIVITAASDSIIAARPGNGFLIERAKDPKRLDLSIDGVTLIVHKR
jgi:hypothetical protein